MMMHMTTTLIVVVVVVVVIISLPAAAAVFRPGRCHCSLSRSQRSSEMTGQALDGSAVMLDNGHLTLTVADRSDRSNEASDGVQPRVSNSLLIYD